MSANADLQPEDERPPEDVQGSEMSANADLALQATCPDLVVQGSKMSANADAGGAAKDSPEMCKVPKYLLTQMKYLVTKNSYLIFLLEKNSL